MALSFLKSNSAGRKVLVLIWFAFFLCSAAIIAGLYFGRFIETDTFRTSMGQLSKIYGPYVGSVTLYYWGTTAKAARAGTSARAAADGVGLVLAIVGSLAWNLILFAFLMAILFAQGTIETAMENMEHIGGILSWLVSGALGYYFATGK